MCFPASLLNINAPSLQLAGSARDPSAGALGGCSAAEGRELSGVLFTELMKINRAVKCFGFVFSETLRIAAPQLVKQWKLKLERGE